LDKETIIMSYDLANDHELVKANVHGHQVRAIAASQVFYNHVPIEAGVTGRHLEMS